MTQRIDQSKKLAIFWHIMRVSQTKEYILCYLLLNAYIVAAPMVIIHANTTLFYALTYMCWSSDKTAVKTENIWIIVHIHSWAARTERT